MDNIEDKKVILASQLPDICQSILSDVVEKTSKIVDNMPDSPTTDLIYELMHAAAICMDVTVAAFTKDESFFDEHKETIGLFLTLYEDKVEELLKRNESEAV